MDNQQRIKTLRHFAAGGNATFVAHSLGLPVDEVNQVLAEFDHNRDKAAAEARRLRTGAAPEPVEKVYGLDLSLASTGIACNAGWTDTLKPPAKLRGHERLAWLLGAIKEHVRSADLVIVEGPSYGSQKGQAGHHERAGLWWMVTHWLWTAGVPFAVAPPSSVKKYATGSGVAGKDAMLLAAAKRFPWFDGDNNACDGLWLCAAGADHLGVPMVAMPQAHRAALAGVEWPVLAGTELAA